jgi:hypothetical protein
MEATAFNQDMSSWNVIKGSRSGSMFKSSAMPCDGGSGQYPQSCTGTCPNDCACSDDQSDDQDLPPGMLLVPNDPMMA